MIKAATTAASGSSHVCQTLERVLKLIEDLKSTFELLLVHCAFSYAVNKR